LAVFGRAVSGAVRGGMPPLDAYEKFGVF